MSEEKRNNFTDGYSNLSKKIQTKEGVNFASSFLQSTLSLHDIDRLFNNDGLLSVCVEAPAMDAFLTGIETDSDKIKKLYKDTQHKIREAIILSRAFGGAYLYLEGDSLKVFSPLDLSISKIEYNPLRDDYLEPLEVEVAETGEELDVSRLIFIHEKSTINLRRSNDGLGVGVVQKIIEHIVRWDSSLSQSTDILNQLNQSVIKLQDLNSVIAEDREDDILKRLDTINLLKSNLSILAIDKEDEYVNVTKTLSGVKEIIQENAIAISAVTKIPYSRLFGKTVTGIGQTHDNDMKNYYDTVVSDVREYHIRPIFNKIMKLKGVYSEFEFMPIIEPTTKERLEEQELKINNALRMLDAGLISESEAKRLING